MRDMRARTVRPVPVAFAEGEAASGQAEEEISAGTVDLRTALVRIGIFLGFLAAMGSLLVFLRRRGGFFPSLRRAAQIAVVDTLSLGSRHYLAVVEWDGRRFFIGITQRQISLLGEGAGTAGGNAPLRREREPWASGS
jgi:flagellar biogenesis protein FliO